MNLKNYTSEIRPEVSMGNIERKLIEIGANHISKKYEDKICKGITFLYFDEKHNRTLAFHLKAQVSECYTILFNQYKKPTADTKIRVLNQASRTSWKILSDWVDIQCSMILLGQAEPLQMFLPFVYDIATEETLYDKLKSGKINFLPESTNQ